MARREYTERDRGGPCGCAGGTGRTADAEGWQGVLRSGRGWARREWGLPRSRRSTWALTAFALVWTTALTSCQRQDPLGPDALLHPAAGVHAPVLIEQDDGRRWPSDPYALAEASVAGDTLTLRVHFGGGCETHRFALVVTRLFMESDPVQIPATLAHDGRDDACDAVVNETLRFDLTPVRRIYQEAYGAGPATLVLVVDGRGVRYSF